MDKKTTKIAFLLIAVFTTITCGIEEHPLRYDLIDANFSWQHVDLNNDGEYEDYVTTIKNQYGCGSCYLFSTIGALEIQFQIDHGLQIDLDLSEQNIYNCGNFSCPNGGDPRNVMNYIMKHGVLEESYSNIWDWGECKSCAKSGDVDYSKVSFYSFTEYEDVIGEDKNKPQSQSQP